MFIVVFMGVSFLLQSRFRARWIVVGRRRAPVRVLPPKLLGARVQVDQEIRLQIGVCLELLKRLPDGLYIRVVAVVLQRGAQRARQDLAVPQEGVRLRQDRVARRLAGAAPLLVQGGDADRREV